MPGTFNGIGTAYYGKRDFEPDGSFVTTEWIVFAYVPLLPIGSHRVIEGDTQGGWYVVYSNSRTTYAVLDSMPPHLVQVGSVYGFMAGVILCMLLASWLRLDAGFWFVLAPWLLLPFLVRHRARRRARAQWASLAEPSSGGPDAVG